MLTSPLKANAGDGLTVYSVREPTIRNLTRRRSLLPITKIVLIVACTLLSRPLAAHAESCSACNATCARDFKKTCLFPERCRTALLSCEAQCRLEVCRGPDAWRAFTTVDPIVGDRRTRRTNRGPNVVASE